MFSNINQPCVEKYNRTALVLSMRMRTVKNQNSLKKVYNYQA